VGVDGLLVQGVDHGHLGLPAGSGALAGHLVEPPTGAPAQEDPGPIAGEALPTLPPIAPPGP
jgi:hypothetical protein